MEPSVVYAQDIPGYIRDGFETLIIKNIKEKARLQFIEPTRIQIGHYRLAAGARIPKAFREQGIARDQIYEARIFLGRDRMFTDELWLLWFDRQQWRMGLNLFPDPLT
jgi:hypothetical protein